MLLTRELLKVAKRINPCNQDLNPENYKGSRFQWCATWSAFKDDRAKTRSVSGQREDKGAADSMREFVGSIRPQGTLAGTVSQPRPRRGRDQPVLTVGGVLSGSHRAHDAAWSRR